MKTSQKQQEQTRRQIVQSAVELMSRQGFEGTTMKDVARQAGIGDATIYKYFPTKERLVLGYFDQVVADALVATQQTPGLASYSLQEKLQRLTDAVLEALLPDREFVALARTLAARSPLLLLGEQMAAKQALRLAVQGFLAAAEAAGEIEPCDFQATLGGLYTDYLLGVMAYWLADESDQFADTTQLVDLSLGVLVLTLRAGLVNRVLELGGFVLRSQMARMMAHGSGLLDLLRLARQSFAPSASPPAAAAGPAPRRKPARSAPKPKPDAADPPAPRPRATRAKAPRKAAP